MPTPDSPKSSLSPVPQGLQGDLESELKGLVTELFNLGTTVIHDSTKEKEGAKQVGAAVNKVVDHLAQVDRLSQSVRTMIPMQILTDIDNARNPMQLTKERIERAATENQFMNGKISALTSYHKMLVESLCQNFPDLEEQLTAASDDGHAG